MKKTISIVIPAFNEEQVIPQLTAALRRVMNVNPMYNWETIIVENGSVDSTLRALLLARKKDKRIKILQLAKNAGCDGGILAGLHYAKGDAAVVMMADLQDNPEVIAQFIKKWNEGYDVVYAVVSKRTNVSLYKRFGAIVFYWIMDRLSKGVVPQNVSAFRLIDKRVYQAFLALPERNTSFSGLVSWMGFRQTGISAVREKRAAGEPKSDFKTLFMVALNNIISFSNFPLRIPWIFSFIFLLGGLIAAGNSYVTSSLFLFSFSLFSALLGIQGEYISRILDEARQRPNFIVQKTFGITV